jgi:hypothetical protein
VGLMVSYNGEGCRGDEKAMAGLLGGRPALGTC